MKKIRFIITLFFIGAVTFAYSQSSKKISETIEKAYDKFQPSGLSVVIVKDGKIEYINSFGYKIKQEKQKVKNNSIFNIASCSKAFTAAAVGKLVSEEKLAWEDKVIDYIPEFRLSDPYITSELTIEDILSHRTGLSTFTGDLLWYSTNYTNEEIIRRMRYLPIENDFREDYGYQNNMFMLGGEIIERITGKTWSEYIQENIFEPLDMKNTYPSIDEMTQFDNLAYPHIENQKIEPYDFNGSKPAGAIMSNVKDLSHWVMMLLNYGNYNDKEVLPKSVVRKCFAPHTQLSVSEQNEKMGIHFRDYGLGWNMFDYSGQKVIEHNGGMPGYISKVTLVPEKRLGFAILNNGMGIYVNEAIKTFILEHYLKDEITRNWNETFMNFKKQREKRLEKRKEKRIASRVKYTTPSLNKEGYVGTYKDKMYGKARIKIIDGNLNLTLLPAKEVFTSPMENWHYDTFKIEFNDAFLPFGLVTFDFNPAGEVIGFKIDLPSNDFHFNKLNFEKIPG